MKRAGIDALVDKLGIYDAIRFIQSQGLGEGNWTNERHKLPDMTPATIERKARALQRAKPAAATDRKTKTAVRKSAPQGR